MTREIIARVPEKYQHCTLDNFDANPDAPALAEARRFVQAYIGWAEAGKPTTRSPAVFFTSRRVDPAETKKIAPGNGKTHLAVGILHAVALAGYGRIYRHERHPSDVYPNLVFVSATSFLDEVRACYGRDKPKTVEEVIGRYVAADLLVFDDLGTEDGEAPDAMQKMFTLLEKRTKARIFTSNYRLSVLEARPNPEWMKLVSRMRVGTRSVVLTGPDRRRPEDDPWKEWTK